MHFFAIAKEITTDEGSMKYKILLGLLVVSVLAGSVADAEDELPEVLKNLPNGWQSGTPFDMDAVTLAIDKLKKTSSKRLVKKLMGRKPDTIKGRHHWTYFGKFVDELTEREWRGLQIEFFGSGGVERAIFIGFREKDKKKKKAST